MTLMGKWKQFLFGLIITSALISAGAVIGWSVEVARISADPSKSFQTNIDIEEWLVATAGLAAVITSLLAGWLIETVGPCRLVQFLMVPTSIAWIVMATADSLPWLFIGRFITGCYVQLVMITIQPFVAEITQADIRGSIACLPEFVFSLGLLVMYIFARFLSWQNGTLITGVLMFPVMAMYLYVPESPYWFIRKGYFKDALRSLRRLRPSGHDVDSELQQIKEVVVDVRGTKGTFLEQIHALREPANFRPTILLSILFILRELSGALVIFIYAPFFFTTAGVPIDPFSATVLVGVSRLLFTFVSATLVDSVGRRTLLISSTTVSAAMLFITAIVLLNPYPFLTWIPLIAVIIFVAAFGIGPGPIMWVLLGEILPTPVRSISSSICNIIFCVMFYLETLYFSVFLEEFGLPNLMFIFGIFNLINALVVWLFLPETKNRTLEDLQTAFIGATLRPFKNQREGYLQPYGTTLSDKTRLVS